MTTPTTTPTGRLVSARVADELDRIREEIACIRGLMTCAPTLDYFTDQGKDGLVSLLAGWGDALHRLTAPDDRPDSMPAAAPVSRETPPAPTIAPDAPMVTDPLYVADLCALAIPAGTAPLEAADIWLADAAVISGHLADADPEDSPSRVTLNALAALCVDLARAITRAESRARRPEVLP